MLIIAQIYVLPFSRNQVSFVNLAQVRWWVTDPVPGLRITVIFISILISQTIREFLNDSWCFCARFPSPEAASWIDMDMYVQFHGWLNEKKINSHDDYFLLSMSVKREEWKEFISRQTRRLLNNKQPIWLWSFILFHSLDRNSNFRNVNLIN